MSLRLADRLSVARHQQFVGREKELALFQSLLSAADLPFFVLYIFGPAGVGKTALLDEFAHLCEQSGTPAARIDGCNLEPSPEAFIAALQCNLGLMPPDSPLNFLASQSDHHVLLIDAYEALAALDDWIWGVFLPELPENVLAVLVSANPPASAWQADPGWHSVIRVMPLRNLTPPESRAYLSSREIPIEQHEGILDFTHGHPLALSLLADVCAQRPGFHFQPASAPDTIQALLERLVQRVPGPAHRTALEACALVRVTTEALLAEMLAMSEPSSSLPAHPDSPERSGVSSQQGHRPGTREAGESARELFQWLRGLSFIEARQGGLCPHDLVREVLAADLRWRNPDWYAELHRRARNYYVSRVQQTTGQAQQRVLYDYIYLHRDNSLVRPFFEWQAGPSTLTDAVRASDIPALLAMVSQHEGKDSARLAEHWLTRPPCQGLVFRSPQGEPAGFLALVALQQANSDDMNADPAAQAAWRYLQDHAPLRPGEGATLVRFWMARDNYQAVSPMQSLIFIQTVQHYLTTPGLAFTFFPCAEPEFWAPMLDYVDLVRIPDADFEVGGRRFGVYGHDWRTVPPTAWLELLAEREIALTPQIAPSPAARQTLLVLSRPDFEAAVRRALHDYAQPEALLANPLLRSRIVVEEAGVRATPAERAAALQTLVEGAVQLLEASPREIKFYRTLYHTYLHPAPTQEQAAELLDVPFSSYRRYLKVGVDRVVEMLWQREIGAPKK